MRQTGSSGTRAGHRAWLISWRKGRAAAAAAAVIAALAGTTLTGVPAASASPDVTVIVSATGLLSPVGAVLGIGGTILAQYHLIDAVDAVIPAALEPVLAALPGISVTADATVSVQSTVESTGPHTPSDAFLQETGAAQLGPSGKGRCTAETKTLQSNASVAWLCPEKATHRHRCRVQVQLRKRCGH